MFKLNVFKHDKNGRFFKKLFEKLLFSHKNEVVSATFQKKLFTHVRIVFFSKKVFRTPWSHTHETMFVFQKTFSNNVVKQ